MKADLRWDQTLQQHLQMPERQTWGKMHSHLSMSEGETDHKWKEQTAYKGQKDRAGRNWDENLLKSWAKMINNRPN